MRSVPRELTPVLAQTITTLIGKLGSSWDSDGGVTAYAKADQALKTRAGIASHRLFALERLGYVTLVRASEGRRAGRVLSIRFSNHALGAAKAVEEELAAQRRQKSPANQSRQLRVKRLESRPSKYRRPLLGSAAWYSQQRQLQLR